MKLSVVVPIHNEEDNIDPLIDKVSGALQHESYELILVDDGSTDRSVERIRKRCNEKVKLLILSRNYGQTMAMAAGIDHAQGQIIATMDGDLQNDPIDIPRMIHNLEQGDWDMVAGRRRKREDGMFLRKVPSKIANYLIRRITQVPVRDLGCTLKVFRKDYAKNLGLYGELHRFIPVLAKQNGARILEIDVKHHARIHGNSKYGLGRTTRVVSDLLLMAFWQKFLKRPIHLFGPPGIACILFGTLINFYLLAIRLLGEDIWGRPLLILGVLLFLGGLQFLSIGLILEVQMRTYFESQDKKPYSIREEVHYAQNQQETKDSTQSVSYNHKFVVPLAES